nr:hypothetical protein BgiMline_011580 [Biomphalaria glabrata]
MATLSSNASFVFVWRLPGKLSDSNNRSLSHNDSHVNHFSMGAEVGLVATCSVAEVGLVATCSVAEVGLVATYSVAEVGLVATYSVAEVGLVATCSVAEVGLVTTYSVLQKLV